ncbi:hypothetical protein EON83_00095 [bacterium]|nr:MAG: hypothetical protein EON83_00095 [bacterium]
MPLTLADAAKLSDNQLVKGVIETFVKESVILDRIPLMPIEGNALAYNEEGTLPGIAFRAVNGSYTESAGAVNDKSEKLFIMGGDVDVDKFIVKTRGNINDQRAIQTTMKVKALTYQFQNAFFNGDTDTDPLQFNGLKKRLINNQLITTGTNGLGIITGGHDFLDQLDNLFAAVKGGKPDALYMNAFVKARLRSLARRLAGWHTYLEIETGKMIDSYNGVPILDPGENADGSLVLPQTETQGTSNDCSSIYAVRFGESEADAAVTGLTNGGVMVDDLGELETKPAYRTRIELYAGLALFGGKGAARLRGVRLG